MSERAVFITQSAAYRAAERMRFIKRDANWKPHYVRGELVGYTVAYLSDDGWHIVTENDVSLFGLM